MSNDKAYSIAVTVVAAVFGALTIHYDVKYEEERLHHESLRQSLKEQKDICAIQNVVMDACEEYLSTIDEPDSAQKIFIQTWVWADKKLNE